MVAQNTYYVHLQFDFHCQYVASEQRLECCTSALLSWGLLLHFYTI